MDTKHIWEKVEQEVVNNREISLGKYYSYGLDHDIKHLGMVFSRYKFAVKMIGNYKKVNVLELGCNYGLGAPFVRQNTNCEYFLGVDFDDEAIQLAKKNFANEMTCFYSEDFLGKDYRHVASFDAIISLDVIEHIEKKNEDLFLQTICKNLSKHGTVILGTPNISMSAYASRASQISHVNLFDQQRLIRLFEKYFNNVFCFGMTDEVVHTGFYPMSCYIFILACNKKQKQEIVE